MANEAWRWFGVRGESVRLGPVAKLIGRHSGQPCFVYLYRRDNAATVLRFDHASLDEAKEHLARLRSRLDEHVHDFCREVGIAVDWVVGPGSDVRPAPEAAWTSVNRIPPASW